VTRSGAELARLIVTVCRVLAHEGLVKGFGHVSARLPGGGEYVITPKKPLGLVRRGELLTIAIDNGAVVRGAGQPPLEGVIHTAIYRARPDVQAIVRAQPPTVEAFGVVGRAVRPAHQFGAVMLGETPVHRETDPIATEEAAAALVATLGDRTGVILRGNGVVVTGRTLVEAALRALNLEESARLELMANQLGAPNYYTPDEVKRIGGEILLESQQGRAWAYWTARLGRRS